jgi:ABC-type transporter Mla subunit MlaD
MRATDKKFRDVTNDLEDLALDMKGTVRKLKQGISDLEQTTKTLDKRLKEIEDLTLIQEGKAEAAEEALEED